MNRGCPPIHQCEEVERERQNTKHEYISARCNWTEQLIFFAMWMVWQQNIFRAAQTKLFDFVQRQRDV